MTEEAKGRLPRDTSWYTPLHDAAANDHLPVVMYLVTNAKPKIPKSLAGYTPLHEAARNGHVAVCRYLMRKMKDKNPAGVSDECFTPLHYAAMNGHLKVCVAIMGKVENKSPRCWNEATPLHYAARYGHLDVVKYMMENDSGGDKNPVDTSGDTLLHEAALSEKPDVCRYIWHETDKNWQRNTSGETPFKVAFDEWSRNTPLGKNVKLNTVLYVLLEFEVEKTTSIANARLLNTFKKIFTARIDQDGHLYVVLNVT